MYTKLTFSLFALPTNSGSDDAARDGPELINFRWQRPRSYTDGMDSQSYGIFFSTGQLLLPCSHPG
jgi:hypothetical protein